MTNADRIRKMSDKELANYLYREISALCRGCDWYKDRRCNWIITEEDWFNWLKEEAS